MMPTFPTAEIIRRRQRLVRVCRFALLLSLSVGLIGPQYIERKDDALIFAWAFVAFGVPGMCILLGRRAFKTGPKLVVLLRPFGETEISHSIRQLVRARLSFIGFVLTLGDNALKPPKRRDQVLRLTSNLGNGMLRWMAPMSLRVGSRQELRQVGNIVQRPYRLTWLWLLSRARLLIVPVEDHLWKEAVSKLLQQADVIAVDLSEVGTGTIWELEELKRSGWHRKTLFLVAQGRVENGRTLVEAFFPECSSRLFAYRSNGSVVRDREMIGQLDQMLASQRGQPERPQSLRRSQRSYSRQPRQSARARATESGMPAGTSCLATGRVPARSVRCPIPRRR